jgi:hypothetical protein
MENIMAKKETFQETEAKELDVPFDFETFEFKTLEDFKTYNQHVRRAFREAKKANPRCDPPMKIKVPDASFHQHMTVKFQRFDQPENVLKVRVYTKDIDWTGQLKPGGTYELPLPVIKFLNKLATPIFSEVKVENGGETKTETKQTGERPRFACQLVDLAA